MRLACRSRDVPVKLKLTSGRALSGDVKVDEFSLETEIIPLSACLSSILEDGLSGDLWLDRQRFKECSTKDCCDQLAMSWTEPFPVEFVSPFQAFPILPVSSLQSPPMPGPASRYLFPQPPPRRSLSSIILSSCPEHSLQPFRPPEIHRKAVRPIPNFP